MQWLRKEVGFPCGRRHRGRPGPLEVPAAAVLPAPQPPQGTAGQALVRCGMTRAHDAHAPNAGTSLRTVSGCLDQSIPLLPFNTQSANHLLHDEPPYLCFPSVSNICVVCFSLLQLLLRVTEPAWFLSSCFCCLLQIKLSNCQGSNLWQTLHRRNAVIGSPEAEFGDLCLMCRGVPEKPQKN